jgi:hypothetical protein
MEKGFECTCARLKRAACSILSDYNRTLFEGEIMAIEQNYRAEASRVKSK